jgi:HSP20 family protein
LEGVIQQGTSLRRNIGQLVEDALRPALPPPRLNADIYETGDGDTYIVEIAVPGLDVTEIDVEATPDMLTVTTRPREQDGQSNRRYLLQEQQTQGMSRVFQFPDEIEPDGIKASVQAGMLKIEAPKAAASRRRVIKLTPQSSS